MINIPARNHLYFNLCLFNFFYEQTKGDLRSADEYYSRAILADPKDGEVLSKYANLVWEFYHDKHRANNYFERAVQASAQDRLAPINYKYYSSQSSLFTIAFFFSRFYLYILLA